VQISRRLAPSAVLAVFVASLIGLTPAHAGVDPGLCKQDASSSRAKILPDFGVSACFGGSQLVLRDTKTLVLNVSRSGDVGAPSRDEGDLGLAADVERLHAKGNPNIFLPDDTLFFPVGSGAGTVGIRSSSDNGFYAIATTIADFFPGGPNALVGAVTTFTTEVNDDFDQYQTCLTGKNWFAQLGCRALLIRNLNFAVARGTFNAVVGVSEGTVAAALGAILSADTWSNWVAANVADTDASLHESGTIHIAAVSAPTTAATQAPPATTTSTSHAPPASTISTVPSTTSTGPAESSSAPTCAAFQAMSVSQREQAIVVMQAAHHDTTGAVVAYGSVELFCHVYPDQTIDGVYNGSL